MFRTGHKNEPTPIDLPESPRPERVAVEPVVAEQPVAPSAPATAVPAARRDANIGKGVTFDGTLRFTGAMTIDGTFKGHILDGGTLVIGTGAKVMADVTCGAIEVFGEVQGSLTGTRAVELRAAARVMADVTTPSLRIADGAVLDGAVRMSGTPNGSRKQSERGKRRASIIDADQETEMAGTDAIPLG